MYTERIRDLGESKLTARRQVGSVLDIIDRAWATPLRPDQWWVADFTYVWTLAGFVYVSFVTDWGHLPLAGDYSRRILGWRVSTAKTTPLVASGGGGGAVPPPPRQRRLPRPRPDSSLRCGVARRIQLVAATPR